VRTPFCFQGRAVLEQAEPEFDPASATLRQARYVPDAKRGLSAARFRTLLAGEREFS